MSAFRMTVVHESPPFSFVFSGDVFEDQEANATAMLTAIREGLEANGYDVEIDMEYSTKVRL